jgi:hypothetical protein
MAILFCLNPSEGFPGWMSPMARVRTILLDLYEQRVDCIYKILHWPTVLCEVVRGDLENPSSSPSAQVLESAIYFMALCSITDEEAVHLGLDNMLDLIQHIELQQKSPSQKRIFYEIPMRPCFRHLLYFWYVDESKALDGSDPFYERKIIH